MFVLTERSQTARYFIKATLLKKIRNHTFPRNVNRCTGDKMKQTNEIQIISSDLLLIDIVWHLHRVNTFLQVHNEAKSVFEYFET